MWECHTSEQIDAVGQRPAMKVREFKSEVRFFVRHDIERIFAYRRESLRARCKWVSKKATFALAGEPSG